MKTYDRPIRSGLRLSVTACAMLALLVGCAEQRNGLSQSRMDERFAQLMRNDAGTGEQPTALVPAGGTGASATAGRDEPPRRPAIVERGGLRIQVPQTSTRPTLSGENVELN
jgi:general secretion pathway protein D